MGVVRLDLLVQVDDLHVQGVVLDLGDPPGLLRDQRRQQVDRLPLAVHATQLDGVDGAGRQPLDVRRDADPPRLVRFVLDRDGQQRVGLGVEQVVDSGRDRLEPNRRDRPAARWFRVRAAPPSSSSARLVPSPRRPA